MGHNHVGGGITEHRHITIQPPCYFIQLPGEIRNMIYDFLFYSTRLAFGKRALRKWMFKIIKPALHSLAILRVCRQINTEAKDLWIDKVLFHFEDIPDMTHKLDDAPIGVVPKIRHMRLGGRLITTQTLGGMQCLHLPLGMRLDTLTILGLPFPMLANTSFEELFLHTNGWRELRYITSVSLRQCFEHCFLRRLPREPTRPGETVMRRDGLELGDSVFIYESTEDGLTGAVLNPKTRKLLTRKDLLVEWDFDELQVEPLKAMLKKREMMHVVKRDPNMSIVQHLPPCSVDNIKVSISRNSHWLHENPFRNLPSHRSLADTALFAGFEADSYDDVDEYEWDPFEDMYSDV
ncbi:hypothetical protein FQN54_002432 [Arachnomyces sp. PD_36]|nr:hypothetical protein FQN54_002432 [Arachnomyces sp. PD_36]